MAASGTVGFLFCFVRYFIMGLHETRYLELTILDLHLEKSKDGASLCTLTSMICNLWHISELISSQACFNDMGIVYVFASVIHLNSSIGQGAL